MTGHEHSAVDIITRVIALCSVTHTFAPPWDWVPPGGDGREWLADFPTTKKYYKLFIYIIGYMAASGRSTVWKGSISMPNQVDKGTPESMPKG